LIDLEKGIFFGITLSLALYLYRTSRPTIRDIVPDPTNEKHKFSIPREGMHECPQLKTVRIDGSIFFGAVNHIQTSLQQIDEYNPQQKHVLVVADGINFVDLAGGEMLVQEAKRRKKMSGGLYFKGVKEGACEMIKKGGYITEIGSENIFSSKTTAIATIYTKLDPEICRNCTVRIFRECNQALPDGEPRKP